MFITDFSVRRPVTAMMLVLIIVVLGVISFFRLPVDLLPDLEFPVASVITEYEGVGPEQIETSLTRLIESSVNRVDGVKNIYSASQRGASIVQVEFDWGTDMDLACQEIREKLDELGTGYFGLPEDSKRPIIIKYNPADMPLMFLALSGGAETEAHRLKEIADDYIEKQMEAVEGVAWVAIFAGAEREILVSLDRELLSAYHLSIAQVIRKLSSENIDLTCGHLKEGYKDHLVRTRGKFESVEELREIVIAVRGGIPIHLSEVAKVYDTYGEQYVHSRANLEPSVGIMLMKQAGTNTVQVCRRAWRKVRQIEKRLPQGLKITTGFDQAEYINRAIGNLGGNALWGGILAIFVLFLFLRHIRPLVIIGLAIPISLLAAFIPIYFSRMTLNMMSLGGLALAIGMLLDNSIVVLENAFRRMQEGKESRIEAARKGASEVAAPIIASTFTTIGVFVPIAFTTGIAARIFRELALTVSYSLLASLFLALTLVPMMASKILRVSLHQREESLLKIKGEYRKFLSISLTHPGRTITIAFTLLLLSLLLIFPIGKEFMPTANDRMFMIQLSLPEGTRLEETNKAAREVEKILLSLPELESEQMIVGIAGGGSGQDTLTSHQAMGIVRLVKAGERKRKTAEVIEEVREKIRALAQIEKSDFANLQTMSIGGEEGKPVEVKIYGKSLTTLAELSKKVRKRIEGIEGLRDVEETFAYGSPEMQIKFDREKCALYGLSVGEAASVLEAAIAGKIATRFEREGEEIDVRVRLREEDRLNLRDIERICILSPQGVEVQVGDIAEIHRSTGPTKIVRENQKRKVSILANISQLRDLGHTMEEVNKKLAGLEMPLGYFIEYGGSYKSMMESFINLGIAFLLAMLLVYMIMAAQFESLLHPFVIMFSIPFALVGVLWTLFLTGVNLSVNALIGVIMLSGIVVNNGIVLIDYTNRLRKEGMEKREAMLKATEVRFRPILMTTCTTILGVTPMIFMGGSGAEMRRPLALALAGGLLFGSIVTLIITPAVYITLDNLSGRIKKRLHLSKNVSAQ